MKEKRNPKFNGKKKKVNQKVKEEIKEEVENKAGLKNHSQYGNPNWYFTDGELAEQASRFSFQSFIGNGELSQQALLPSIMTILLNPAVGGYVGQTQEFDDPTDDAAVQAVNLCARKIYTRLSSMSGRTANYQPQDVMMAILGIGELISITAYIRRVFGVAYTWNWRNRDFPKHIIKAMGVDPDDLFANIAKYRTQFNTIVNIINKIPIPQNITWFEKCAALYTTLFKDSPDEMSQIYIMAPASTWIVDESSSPDGTILKTTPVVCDLQTFTIKVQNMSVYLTLLQNMANALLTSTTYNLVYADILNMSAKQNVPLMTLNLVGEDYRVVPEYDEEFLLHIHNMNIFQVSYPDYFTNTLADLTGRSTSNCNDVFQDPATNNLIYAPVFKITDSKDLTDIGVTTDQAASVLNGSDLVDFPYGNPDITERLEATRFSIRLNVDEITPGETGEDAWALAKTLPDHYAVCAGMWVGGQITTSRYLKTTTSRNAISQPTQTLLEKFRYAPLVYRFRTDGLIDLVVGDINYFTHLDGAWLKRLNALCLQGLLELR